jgi:hypothetical protein
MVVLEAGVASFSLGEQRDVAPGAHVRGQLRA